eukprot:snap_masked-scaffold_24-processed-gene-3.24-mRNA-1 protein AED:1.00 eAED:1.00 QI:0/-1/0/0/-1/1/1/0/202
MNSDLFGIKQKPTNFVTPFKETETIKPKRAFLSVGSPVYSSVRYSFDLTPSSAEGSKLEITHNQNKRRQLKYWKYASILSLTGGFILLIIGVSLSISDSFKSTSGESSPTRSPVEFAQEICSLQRNENEEEFGAYIPGFCISDTEFVRCYNGTAVVVNGTPIQQCGDRPGTGFCRCEIFTVVEDFFLCEEERSNLPGNCTQI